MKIATVSDNGTSISQHFGRATMYVVFTIENGKVIDKEKRLRSHLAKANCQDDDKSNCHDGQANHCFNVASLAKHSNMADAIADCQVVIAGGMGYGAYNSLKSRGLEPIITDKESIDEAISLFLCSKLDNLMKKLH